MTQGKTAYRLLIPNWTPTTINQLYSGHWAKRARLKRSDQEIVAAYAMQQERTSND